MFSWPHTLKKEGSTLRRVAFVEMMIPFFSRQTFEVSSVYFQENVSGWGLDEVLWPKRIGKQHMMVLDSLAVGHYRPLQDRFQKL